MQTPGEEQKVPFPTWLCCHLSHEETPEHGWTPECHKAELQHLKVSSGSSDMEGKEKGILTLAFRALGLTSSRDLSQLFFWRIWRKRSQSTGSWQTLCQLSKRARKEILITTRLRVTPQCLVQLWRSYSGSYWKQPERQWRRWSQQTRVQEGNVPLNEVNFLLLQGHPGRWPREASWCNLVSCQKSCQDCFSQYASGLNIQPLARKIHSTRADGLGTKS